MVALVAGWVWRRIGWRYTLLVIGAAGVTGVIWLIKDLIDRGRPIGAAIDDPSFPSGHTAWAVAVFGVLAVLALQRRRWLGAIACVVLAGAMGPSRVLLGVHWLSDVIAGYAIGLAWLIALLLIGMPWANKRTSPTSSPSISRAGSESSPISQPTSRRSAMRPPSRPCIRGGGQTASPGGARRAHRARSVARRRKAAPRSMGMRHVTAGLPAIAEFVDSASCSGEMVKRLLRLF